MRGGGVEGTGGSLALGALRPPPLRGRGEGRREGDGGCEAHHILTMMSSVPSSMVYCRFVFCSSAVMMRPTMVTWCSSCPSTVKFCSPDAAEGAFFSCLMVTGSSDCFSLAFFACAAQASGIRGGGVSLWANQRPRLLWVCAKPPCRRDRCCPR